MVRIIMFGVVACFLLLTTTATAANFTVVSSLDNPNPGTLRWAINSANANLGPDVINFSILPAGPYTIAVAGQLPALTDMSGVLIDGLTQPGGAAQGLNPPATLNLLITLNGAQAGPACGLWIKSNFNRVQGLVIEEFMQDGIFIEGGPEANVNQIYWNIIGLDRMGTTLRGNGTNMAQLWGGVRIANNPQFPPGIASGNQIVENLISGNYAEGVAIWGAALPGDVSGHIVDKNFIGTDITGLLDRGNKHEGVCLTEGTHDNIVNHNLISGNDWDGVGIQGYDNFPYGAPIQTYSNTVSGNTIGLNLAGSLLPNGMQGVAIGTYGQNYFGCADHNTIGPGNVIAYNGANGVLVWEHNIDATNGDCNRIIHNSHYDNTGLGIDLQDNGVTANDAGDPDAKANQELNFPVIDSAVYSGGNTTIYGTLSIDSDPTLAMVEVFKAALDPTGYGEGKTYLVTATPVNALGNWSALVATNLVGDTLTATAIDKNGNTSEFSANVVVFKSQPPQVDTCTYYKKGYADFCPNGMPDFDQKQNAWWTGMPPGLQWTHCGPVALANCMWWFDSKFEPSPVDPRPFYPGMLTPPANDNYRLVTSYDGQRVWDDHDTNNVRPLVDSLARYALTNASSPGTYVTDLATAATNWIAKAGLSSDYTVRLVPVTPMFGIDSVRAQVLVSQDVILLLGFYQESAPNYCERIGGHYVTVAGTCTDMTTPALCISDPYFDDNEGAAVHPATDHNDASKVSGPHGTIHHDRYDVAISPCSPTMPPGPYFPHELVNYPINPGNVMNFFGTNGYQPWQPVPATGAPLHALIEFAIIICPADTCLGQLPGDVDVDGNFDMADITALVNILMHLAPLPNPPSNADPNGDCVVNWQDAYYLANYINLGGPAPVKCTCLKPKLTCCLDVTGNVDGDAAEGIDISDLTALIDYLYISFTPPVCVEEANCDGDLTGGVDISDLTALIDYLYISFTPVAHCL